jgi:hypothetical protein
MNRLVTAGTAAALIVSLCGCTSGGGDTPRSQTGLSTPPVLEEGQYQLWGEDPKVLLHGITFSREIAMYGTLRYDPAGGCLYVEANQDKILSAWSVSRNPGLRPIVRDGKRGLQTSKGVILEGQRLLTGGDVPRKRTAHAQIPDSCAPQADRIAAFSTVEPA